MTGWRTTLRSACAYLLVLGLLGLFLVFVAATRSPQAPWVERLVSLPVVGIAVDLVRTPFIPPDQRVGAARRPNRPSTSADAAPETSADWILEGPRERELEMLIVGIGASLRRAPEPEAEVVTKTERLGQYAVLSRRPPSWVELELPGSPTGSAWLDLDAPRDLTPPLGNDPLPPGPVASRRADQRVSAAARREMGSDARSLQRWGYTVVTDVDSGRLQEWLGLLKGIEVAYASRYGVEPIGTPRETLAIFSREADYRRFQDQVEGLEGLGSGISTGHASGGLAALFVAERSDAEVAATLVHEVTHLLTRRAIGPALPLWLDEGIAEDFAYFAGPSARPLADYRSRSGNQIRIWGPLAGLQLLVGTGEPPPRLSRLFDFDLDLFVRAEDGAALYTQSAFFVAFLLGEDFGVVDWNGSSAPDAESSGEVAELPPAGGFRRFLRSLAEGERPTLEQLLTALRAAQRSTQREDLATEWTTETLQRRFDRYLELVDRATPGLSP